jgi:hypothetical protein
MSGGTMSDEKRERREVTPDLGSGFRPIDKNNIPPENAIVLVRYVEGRKETHLRNPKLWSSADQQRVFPAQVIYNRVPFSRTETEFRGFMTLAPHCTGTADAAMYMDGAVADAFDGWMPMPS